MFIARRLAAASELRMQAKESSVPPLAMLGKVAFGSCVASG